MSISLGSIPGFAEIPDTAFAAGAAVSDATMKSLNAAAKFGVVRNEQFQGHYQHSETVACPVSQVDGYVYSRAELIYEISIYWTGAGPGNLNGTQTPPSRGATSGAGSILQMGFKIDSATGVVTCDVSYWNGSKQTDTHDGILLVTVHAQRTR
jgi:hypothetical protein